MKSSCPVFPLNEGPENIVDTLHYELAFIINLTLRHITTFIYEDQYDEHHADTTIT